MLEYVSINVSEGIETDKTDSSRDYIFFIITGTLLG